MRYLMLVAVLCWPARAVVYEWTPNNVKPKPLKTLWITVVTTCNKREVPKGASCDFANDVELGLRSDGVVIWR